MAWARSRISSGGAIPWRAVLSLAPAQLVSWGTLYYGLTFLAEPIRADTGWPLTWIFGAFSAGLLVTAVTAPVVGGLMTRRGARPCLATGSVVAAMALSVVALAPSPGVFAVGWLLAGTAMAATLYEAAFSALRESSGAGFRSGVRALAVVAGLASTLAWPLASWLVASTDWRTAFLVFAALHIAIALPAHLALPGAPSPDGGGTARAASAATSVLAAPPPAGVTLALLATAFALATTVSAALSAQVAVILSAQSVPQELILWTAMLIGPMQIAARALDAALQDTWSPGTLGGLALGLATAGVALLLLAPIQPWLAVLFAVLYGGGHGLMTIVRAMVPTLLAGAAGYARITGWLAGPSHVARALAPAGTALLLEGTSAQWTLAALTAVGGLSVIAFATAQRRRY